MGTKTTRTARNTLEHGRWIREDRRVVEAPDATDTDLLLIGLVSSAHLQSRARTNLQRFRRPNNTPTAEIMISVTRTTTMYDLSAAGATVSLSLVTASVNVQLMPGGNHPQKSVIPAATLSARPGRR